MSQVPQHFVTLSQGQLHYREAGPADGEVLVLVHGFSYGSWTFGFVMPMLAEAGYRVLAIDLYGRGFSDRPKGVTHDRGLYNRLLSEFLDALGIEEPVTLVGNSMGGAVVTDFAAHHPGQVKALVLLVTAGLQLSRAMSLGWLGVPGVGNLIWRWVGPQLAKSYSKDPNVRAHADASFAAQASIPGYYPALLNTLRNYPLDGLQESFELVGVQGTPVTALFGAEDDLIPAEAAEVLATAIPRATIEVVEGGTHDLVMEDPDIVVGAIKALISPGR